MRKAWGRLARFLDINSVVVIGRTIRKWVAVTGILAGILVGAGGLSGFSNQKDECTILLHGLARTSKSMNVIGRALEREGYQVVNINYPSTKYSIEVLADLAIVRGLKECGEAEGISFVTHSMGGILVRQYLKYQEIENLNRVVMLGPPNQGSELIDHIDDFPRFEWVKIEAGRQLGTGQYSLPRLLGEVDFDLGVIAGTKTTNPITSRFLPDPDDGKVSVESTRVEGMSDHIELPVSHSFMMRNRTVIRQIIYYLSHGEFIR